MSGRHAPPRRRRTLYVTLAIGVSVLAIAAGGVSYAAIRYERSHADRILPGVSIYGVDVSGMTGDEAIQAVGGAVERELAAPLTITVGDDHWTVTPATLGRRAAVDAAVAEALAASGDLGTFDRAWHRFRGEPLDLEVPLDFRSRGRSIDAMVDAIAQETAIEPRDAAVELSPDGTDVVFVRARPGAALRVPAARAAIGAALEDGRRTVHLRLRRVAPKVTEDTMGRTIVVRVDRNRLYLYDGFSVMRTFSVATAKPGYTTPAGTWEIYAMRENPTWYNPALDSWGADLPAVIPGGPGNPMGTRAIYITAPGLIRIHGTTDDSSIGRYASHGCIRMHNSEIEQLFELVKVGEHVLVVGARPADAGYWSTPPSADI